MDDDVHYFVVAVLGGPGYLYLVFGLRLLQGLLLADII